MRRLAEIVRRQLQDHPPLELTESDLCRPESDEKSAGRRTGTDADRRKLAREIGQVADYVARLKREIGALKAGEVHAKRLPETIDDLRSVHGATKDAAETIMAAAEAVLEHDPASSDYPGFVMDRVMAMMEACSFQDLAGQRLDRAIDTLLDLERRLERFSKAVKIADAADLFDRKAIMREARREVLLVEGPQNSGAAIEQTEVDKLFG